MPNATYASQTGQGNSLSTLQPITICLKCGRFVKINEQCECEAIFFSYMINTTKN
jgi:hypothetical protein